MRRLIPRLIPLLVSAVLVVAGCQKPPATTDKPAATPAPANTAAATPAAQSGPVAGVEYVQIPNGAPFAPADGTVEVVEVFGYTCPHCAHFEPLLEKWAARQPENVRLVRVPAPFGGYWMPYAKAYYAAQEMGLDAKTHQAVFDAIHTAGSLPPPPTVATDAQIAAFYARHGADPKAFATRMNSASVQAKLKRAMDFIMRAGVEGTPALVVAGKYRVNGRTPEDSLRIVDQLVALEGGSTR